MTDGCPAQATVHADGVLICTMPPGHVKVWVTVERRPDPDWRPYSDVAGENIRAIRKRLGWKVSDLATRCTELGMKMTPAVIENIEHGRRRNGERTRLITVDEVIMIAAAMSVPPSALVPELGAGPAEIPVEFGLHYDVADGIWWSRDDEAWPGP